MTSVTIPNSVTSIEQGAFQGCNSLTFVHISDLAAWCNISFDGSESYPLGRAHHLFLNDTEITDLIIPNNVTSIGREAFSGCSSLTSVTIPNSVTSIEQGAFKGCSSLTSVTISNSVTSIGREAFSGCNGLTSVTIGNSVTSIGEDAFSYCSSLTSITIPNSVTNIGGGTFEGCSGLTSVTIPYSVTSIKQQTFRGCCSLTSVMIPNSVKSIEWGAFDGCGGLTSVTIPNSVTSIGGDAFKDCDLQEVISKIKNPFYIEPNPFSDNTLYKATLYVPIGTINKYKAQGGWKRFVFIEEGDGGGETPIDPIKDFEDNGIRYLISENNTVSVTSKTEKYAGAVVIPSQVYYDGNNFTVTAIAQSAFEGCVDMTAVTIPSSVTTIGGAAFYMCTGLTTIDIPNGVKTIGEGAFSKCEGLTSVTIPGSVTSIGKNAFFQCYGLTQITSGIENPFAIDDGVFPTSVYNNASLLVPSGRKSAYQNTAGWKRFQNIVEANAVGKEYEDNGIRYLISENNTVSVTSKTEKYAGAVVIPSQVYYDGNNFTVTSIAQSAFEGCVDMTSVSIPSSVTTIGDAAFYYCTGLTTVDIPNGVTTIGEGAFSKCGGLTSVTIPGSVTSIGKNAFFQCYGLTQITSGIENPFAIDDGVFPTSVYNNASLLVPSGRKSAYQNTAGWKRFQNIYYADGINTLTYYVDGEEYKSVTYSYGAKIFTLNGRQVNTLQKGINIIRMDDGTIKKVVLGK